MNGNISLSMEIGSAYALQVCMLQIPALVFFSIFHGKFIDPDNLLNYTFSKYFASLGSKLMVTAMVFPQWDMITVILCIFLLSYMYGEGKSNYFKGSILILAYCVVIVGFWFAAFDHEGTIRGVNSVDTLSVTGQMSQLRKFAQAGGLLFDREL
jgi:Ca2+:H+ antiporter